MTMKSLIFVDNPDTATLSKRKQDNEIVLHHVQHSRRQRCSTNFFQLARTPPPLKSLREMR